MVEKVTLRFIIESDNLEKYSLLRALQKLTATSYVNKPHISKSQTQNLTKNPHVSQTFDLRPGMR